MFRHDFGPIFWMHLAIIIVIILAPLLFDVWIIALGMLVYWLQLMVVGDCVLTRLQFGARERTGSSRSFYFHYLKKLGFVDDAARVTRFIDRTQPILILLVGIVWQWLLGFDPLVI
ncbi:MAG TPA: hypothetical protein VJ553_03980 [Candidatus Paceibacterota bacterium]|nr:hypothetical protein [Candidatus Paceibacterota bacterium]